MDRPLNRLATPVNRGRPSNQAISERLTPYPVNVETRPIRHIPVMGIVCPLCKVLMEPPTGVLRGRERHTNCGNCAARLVIWEDENGEPKTIRAI